MHAWVLVFFLGCIGAFNRWTGTEIKIGVAAASQHRIWSSSNSLCESPNPFAFPKLKNEKPPLFCFNKVS